MKRSERLVDLTHYFLENPRQLTQLSYFMDRYSSSKSTISEDMDIVRTIFLAKKIGNLESFSGVNGGVIYQPEIPAEAIYRYVEELAALMRENNRILPGGYLYLSDILGHPRTLRKIAKIIAHEFQNAKVDVVMTIATKGITMAQMTAELLDVPFVIVRRDPKVTEGATLSVNYMSGSSARVESMVLSKRSLSAGQRVLIVDDFMKGGGTLNGMKSLVQEFDCLVAGLSVFVEGPFRGERPLDDYKSLLRVDSIDLADHSIDVQLGNIFSQGIDLFEK